MSDLRSRHLLPLAQEILTESPVLVLQGARQAGKSTLAQEIARHIPAHYYTLDDEYVLTLLRYDPAAFVQQHPDELMVIDEAQREPRLMLALKAAVDRDRQPGRFFLTGSANLLRLPGTGDSLAGRADSLTLRPFSVGERFSRATPEDFVTAILSQETLGRTSDTSASPPLMDLVLSGGFPEPSLREGRSRTRWFESYLERLTTHDATELNAGSFSQHLGSLVQMIAAQGASELVIAKFARHLGIAENTARGYLDLCSTMYLLQETPSWGLGVLGRETRRPKVSLLDTGMAASLTGLTASTARSPGGIEYYGALVEQFVVSEILKQREWSETSYRVFHYRSRGREVDVVIETAAGSLILIEVKSSSTLRPGSWNAMEALSQELGDRVAASVVLYGGDKSMKLGDRLHVLPISSLWS
ncbi:MAG: ATP-binding protein [Micrococcaceae bacterium]